MPIKTNTNFDLYNAKSSKRPVWIVTFDDIPADGSEVSFCTGTFSGITSSYIKILRGITMVPAKFDRVNLSTEFGGYDIEILDKDDIFTGYLDNGVIDAERKVIVKFGYQENTIDEFVTLPYARVYGNIEIGDDLLTYTIKARSVFWKLNQPIVKSLKSTELTADLAAGGASCSVTSTTGFTTGAASDFNSTSTTHIMIGSEIKKYTGNTSTTLTGLTSIYGEDRDYKAGTLVQEIVKLSDGTVSTLTEALLILLLTTEGGTNSSSYDIGGGTGPAAHGFGFGLNENDVDYNQIKTEIGKYSYASPVTDAYWIYDTIENGLEWVQRNILDLVPAQFCLLYNGKLGIKSMEPRVGSEGLASLTTDDMVANPKLTYNSSDILSHIVVQSNFRLGQYKSKKQHECTTVSTAYGNMPEKTFTVDTQAVVDFSVLKKIWFMCLGNPFITADIPVKLKNSLYFPGEMVNITHPHLPFFRTGTRGWTSQCGEVQSLDLSINPDGFESAYNLMFYDQIKLADMFTGYVWTESDINDTNAAYDTSTESSVTANDAYVSFIDDLSDYVMVRVKIVLPGAPGSATDEDIDLKVRVQDTGLGGIDRITKTFKFYYNSAESDTIYQDFGVFLSAKANINRVQLEYIARSAVLSARQIASVEMVLVKSLNFNFSITDTTL